MRCEAPVAEARSVSLKTGFVDAKLLFAWSMP